MNDAQTLSGGCMAKLTDDEEKMLKIVLAVAGDDEKMIRDGVNRALVGIKDHARRQHLWCVLPNAAKARIRRARQKVARCL